jgi:hypothetical protein
MRAARAILLAGLAPLMFSAAAPAQSRPADTQRAATTAPATQSAALSIPITFARGGRQTEMFLLPVPFGHGRIEKAVVLTAFGRTWSPLTDVTQTSAATRATVAVPNVRVPTIFSVVDTRKRVVGEVLAYPDRDVEWDRKITLYASGAPRWFQQWAAATGLPVKPVAPGDLPSANLAPVDGKGKSLLILGWGTAGSDMPDAAKLAKDRKTNVLVLEAGWFGGAAGPVSVAPARMSGGLNEMARQRWALALKFTSHRAAWGGVASRWAWIVDEQGLPLVEEVRPLSDEELRLLPAGEPQIYDKKPEIEPSPKALVSYVPWQQELARSESADVTLLALLSAAANAPKSSAYPWHPVEFPNNVWPDPKTCACPVLLAVRSGGSWKRQGRPNDMPRHVPPTYLVLDLRGQAKGPFTEISLSEYCQQGLGGKTEAILLILGDDKMLDEWEWLKLDRAKKTVNCPEVIWLSDDEMPPSRDGQIRLMLKLTELGVPLAPPKPEENKP